jgi:hypothetical protein
MLTRTFLCPPTFYDVTYSINPFMDPSVKVDRVLAWRQWSRFVDALEGRGLDLQFIEPRDGCPDMVFLGDTGLVLGDRFLCSRFRHRERQPEADHYTRAFGRLGYRVIHPSEPAVLEGLGDITIWGDRAILRPAPDRAVECLPPVRTVRDVGAGSSCLIRVSTISPPRSRFSTRTRSCSTRMRSRPRAERSSSAPSAARSPWASATSSITRRATVWSSATRS